MVSSVPSCERHVKPLRSTEPSCPTITHINVKAGHGLPVLVESDSIKTDVADNVALLIDFNAWDVDISGEAEIMGAATGMTTRSITATSRAMNCDGSADTFPKREQFVHELGIHVESTIRLH